MSFGGVWRFDDVRLARAWRLSCRLIALAGVALVLAQLAGQGGAPGYAGSWLALVVVLCAACAALIARRRRRRRFPDGTLLVVDEAGGACLHPPQQAPLEVEVAAFHRRIGGAWVGVASLSEPDTDLSGSPAARDDRSAAGLAAWLVWLRRARGR